MSKLDAIIKQYEKALQRFEDVLAQDENEYIRDSAIKRFEFIFDLSWKLIKAFLEQEKGIICASPKGCFREAYQQGLPPYDEFWIVMTDMRNKTAHTCREETFEEIYSQLPVTRDHFQTLLKATEPRQS
ncbi:MAG: nucleotidyltransferase substrate binding protein [Nitrospira sp.]|nr:nucleotidyltransferase substrate binding protein [bacterium]MBL7048953.1 nucleotidyltransferase substrate binding protein [Nitrospira sp.]